MLLNEPISKEYKKHFVEKLFVRLFCAEKNEIELKTREEALSSEIEPYIFLLCIMHSVIIAFGILTRAKMPTLSFVQPNQKNIFSMLLRFDIRHLKTNNDTLAITVFFLLECLFQR